MRKLVLAFFLLNMIVSSCTQADQITPTATTTTTMPAVTPTLAISPTPTLAPELQAYLDAALDLMKAKSIYTSAVDWEAVRAQTYLAAEGAQTTRDLYPAIEVALHATGDRHGYILPPEEASTVLGTATAEPLPTIDHKLLKGNIAYLSVPEFASSNNETAAQFADELQNAIRALDAENPCGWVLDLRTNEGGNGFAMLLGVSPLLPQGIVGSYTYTDGTSAVWKIQANQVYLGELLVMALDQPEYELNHPGAPVAVLTGQATTSAGEFVAIAFRGWPNIQSFGQPTLGRTTAPWGYILEDGAILGISAAYFADHTGQVYQEKVTPDVYIRPALHNNPAYFDGSVPQEALDWLLALPACQ